ncbi:MAG: type II toxin-antitoxin system CcdA family antitoxin [Candidatus Riflebacteria bacterium]|nr:type II toxin-antitoxin system CcdA family antitoxin [Candidatus Riflebacteria bacterium]
MPKRTANLTINSELLIIARSLNINISSVLEAALTEIVKQKKREKWLEENKDAINVYNEKIDEFGLFSDELRTFTKTQTLKEFSFECYGDAYERWK